MFLTLIFKNSSWLIASKATGCWRFQAIYSSAFIQQLRIPFKKSALEIKKKIVSFQDSVIDRGGRQGTILKC